MRLRPLGKSGLLVTPVAFGSFKVGRNQKVKYPSAYDLPSDTEAQDLFADVLDLGIRYLDTAPAYGLAEERLGKFLEKNRVPCTVSTKVGERFVDGESTYDFSEKAIRESIARSCDLLKRDVLDIVFIHSDGRDLEIQNDTPVVSILEELKFNGTIGAIGFSGKTIDGAQRALDWADSIMVEYHCHDASHDEVMHAAAAKGIGVVVKKGLAAGHLPAAEAIKFVLSHPAVSSIVIGGLNLRHLRENIAVAEQLVDSESTSESTD